MMMSDICKYGLTWHAMLYILIIQNLSSTHEEKKASDYFQGEYFDEYQKDEHQSGKRKMTLKYNINNVKTYPKRKTQLGNFPRPRRQRLTGKLSHGHPGLIKSHFAS